MTDETWRVLIVDDDEVDRLAIRRGLADAPLPIEVDEETEPERAVSRAREGRYDCLIIDQSLPRITGLELVRTLRGLSLDVPILVVTGQHTERVEAEVFEAGATDYMPKSELTPARLMRRLRYAIRVGRAEALSGEALRQAREAAQARDEILAIVSHDLRGPLSAISIAADALIEEDDRQVRARMSGAIRRGVDRAEKLIRDLLEVSRIEAGRLELMPRPVEAAALIAQAVRDHELVAREAGVAIDAVVDARCGRVLADRDRIAQVFANLVGNGLKYAKAGGSITLRAEPTEQGVDFSVADRGQGIPTEHLMHLFDRFWQGRRQRRGGAGLGLAIAKGIVEAHGGWIRVENEPGHGARFTFRLPSAA